MILINRPGTITLIPNKTDQDRADELKRRTLLIMEPFLRLKDEAAKDGFMIVWQGISPQIPHMAGMRLSICIWVKRLLNDILVSGFEPIVGDANRFTSTLPGVQWFSYVVLPRDITHRHLSMQTGHLRRNRRLQVQARIAVHAYSS